MDEYGTKDSSIWKDPDSYNLINHRDHGIRTGVIKEEVALSELGETGYMVEVWQGGQLVPIFCMKISRFGGVYNYEEFTNRGYTDHLDGSYGARSLCAGDHVIVAYLNGNSREGVILGHFKHEGRARVLLYEDDTSSATMEFLSRNRKSSPTRYASEFNGVEKLINSNGEYRVTFKGQPTNLDKLKEPSKGTSIEKPKYDEKIGSSYYEFDKTGSFTIIDNSKDGGTQSIKIDKPNGKILVVSGKTSLTISKKEESYVIVNKKTTFNSTDEWNLNTKKTTIKSSDLIQAEAKDIKTKGKLDQSGDVSIKGNIKQTGNTEITGDFKNTGQALLAGGTHPLVYDIALTIGIGNLGAPVVSSHVLLKTAMTKAT